MHPHTMNELARHHQAQMRQDAERARLAALVNEAADQRPHRKLRLRRRVTVFPTARPALDH
jgi:hypothetical protein